MTNLQAASIDELFDALARRTHERAPVLAELRTRGYHAQVVKLSADDRAEFLADFSE